MSQGFSTSTSLDSLTFSVYSHALYAAQRERLTSPRSNFSNTASLLWHAYHSLPSPSSSVNWSGFYFRNPSNPAQLLLGPFHGQVACQTIAFGRGVCGAAAQSKRTQLVPDVEKFPGHIACDGASKSEIVVPIIKDDMVRTFNISSCEGLH